MTSVSQSTSQSSGVWQSGKAYEPYMGKWSRMIAQRFIAWLDVAPGSSWLDVGTGTGAVAEAIANNASPAQVVAMDRSDGYLRFAQESGVSGPVRWCIGDATALEFSDRSFDAVVSGLMLNFLADPSRTAREMRRVAAAGAIVAAYVWDYGEGMRILRHFWDVAIDLDRDCIARDEAMRTDAWRPQALERLFQAAGLEQVHVQPLEIQARFDTPAAYWQPFTGGQGTVASYVMSLPSPERDRLKAAVLERLDVAHDGSVTLPVRAWAVRGRRGQS